MGCQYVNTHNPAISNVLNCNTPVQVGDGLHAFYSTWYLSEATQLEDRGRQAHINSDIIQLLVKREQQVALENQKDETRDDNVFVAGVWAML